ncbi:uncharacterized protein BDZ99DRAFT_567192 [Mytilinidion resinicola]|uniref:Mediator of RNA polymerase II transcription subunit 9 n=1 Tax=Mytilinidion resinicola TaxID=574789 RepID=A0A6A6Z4Z7_9PEZI|nr:uncharacterized protein BDZ99DRAFT_567192 [Mytilinidion resinicola]KAF2815327.1 hypothetical protein BDZ99DRAFT_567192 [Mytilinidion resinicola]
MSNPQTPATHPTFALHTTSATPSSTPAPPAPPPLPSPSSFDILPPLHTLLTRLLTTTAQPADPNPTHTVDPEAANQLDIQGLPSEATKLKLKLQRARMAVMALPDVGRAIEEQEEEIGELEERVRGLKAVLEGLGKGGGIKVEEAGDVQMGG